MIRPKKVRPKKAHRRCEKLIGEAANQKRSPSTSQAKHPIKSVRQGQVDHTDQSSRVHQEEKARRSSNQIRLAGSKADASSHQTEASAQPIGAIGWIIFGRIIFRRTFFGRNFFGRIIPQDGIIGSANRSHRSDHLRSDYLRTDFFRMDHPVGQKPPSI